MNMATSQMSGFLQHLRRVLRDGPGVTDGQLLEDYLSRRDDAAFAALVQRHGPMVWGVCRRILSNFQDAEDSFQATFLVLVRRAASIASRELLANWLYGVAHQTALKARATAAKRKERERQVPDMPEPAVTQQDQWRDLQPLLDEELSRLPDKYRAVIVLCDLQGKTRKEAARQLGCPEGTVAGRLARARVMLAGRLVRRGVALSGGTLAALLSHGAASACVPPSLVSSTIQAASLFASGQVAANGVISAKVIALTEGVLKAMFLTKSKIAAAVGLILVSLTSGAGLIYQAQAAQDTTGKEKKGFTVQRADESAGEKGDKTPELQRRIGELEKQIQSLTGEVKALQKKLDASAASPPAKDEVKTFQLHNRDVDEVAQTLWDLCRNKRGKVCITKHNSTNTLIVVGSPDDLGVVEAIITQLEKLPKKGRNED
jgi:RNA polymerase sigma factor (sigma-70 family)